MKISVITYLLPKPFYLRFHSFFHQLIIIYCSVFFLDCQLKTPCATRWNSEYDSVDCILKQNQVALKTVMKQLKLEVLNESDLTLLNEYRAVMGPLAKYLDVLQSETNNYLGCVILCIQKIKIAMTECKDLVPNGYGVAISRGLVSHIERRFDSSLY